MTTTTITRTEEVLASMFTENTGAHFLDSGGAYGRSWERNQSAVARSGMTAVEHFKARDEAWMDDWGCVTIDAFHYLRQRLDYSQPVDHAWQLWVRMDNTERWDDDHKYTNSYGTFDRFVQALIDKGWARRSEFGGGYTYNDENLLSQDFQWAYFEMIGYDENDGSGCPFLDLDATFMGLSIHNGCDARGGFTDYRIFESDPYCMYDYGDASIYYVCDGANDHDPNQLTLDGSTPFACPYANSDGHVHMDIRGGYDEWYWSEGWRSGTGESTKPEPIEDEDHPHNDNYKFACVCGGTLTMAGVEAPYPSS